MKRRSLISAVLRLHAEDRWPDGTLDTIEVETLQPQEWIKANGASLGAMVPLPLDLVEMGLSEALRAKVVAVGACPPIAAGRGQVVLTTVNHLNPNVLTLVVADEQGNGETIHPTAFHKFYSSDREEWVSAENLRGGERVLANAGTLKIVSVARLPGVQRVYNMTVEGEHVYYVSTLGALVHNTCYDPRTGPGDVDTHTLYPNAPSKTFAEQMTPAEASRYQKYWTARNPPQSKPFDIRQRFSTTDGQPSWTTYDEFGRRHREFKLQDPRHGPHQHNYYDYGPRFPNGRRSPDLPIDE